MARTWHKISPCPICGGKVKAADYSRTYLEIMPDGTERPRTYYYYRFACNQNHYWTRGRYFHQSKEGLKGAIRGYNRYAANPHEASLAWRKIQEIHRTERALGRAIREYQRKRALKHE